MAWFKRALDALVLCVLLPIALLLLGSMALAVGVQPLLIYVGSLLAVWLLFAIGVPMLTGVMKPGEILDGFRSRLRSERFYEGEPLPGRKLWFPTFRRAMPSGEGLEGIGSRRMRVYAVDQLPDRLRSGSRTTNRASRPHVEHFGSWPRHRRRRVTSAG